MYEMTLVQQNGGVYIDSREVAEVIGKNHCHLLRDIRGYCNIMEKGGLSNFGLSDFFVESSFINAQNKTMPCYLLSKMGCEMVANKLIGEKGVLFTAAYVSKFNEMEAAKSAELDALIECAKKPEPRLGEINACVRIIVRGMKDFGAEPGQIMAFLQDAYVSFGISVDIDADPDFDEDADADTGDPDYAARSWYTAQEIAKRCGLYSLYGKPHAQAASCILNENIFISTAHKRSDAEVYGNGYPGICYRYDNHALTAVMQWLLENEFPDTVYGFERTFHVQYSNT